MEVAKEILNQIKALDKWALGAWGANTIIGGNVYKNMEGVKFKVSGTKAKRGSWAMIVLDEAKDLYNVYTYRILKGTVKFDNEIEGIYCDQLVEILDGMIG